MMFSRRLLTLCVFVYGAVAVPLSKKEECARHCTENDDLLLTPGNTYTYDYETTTVTSVHGTTQDKSQLQMTAQVDIQVLSKCDLSLRLRGVTLKQSDPQSPDYLNSIRGGREFASAIERHVLRFSYQNGKVEHVCPSEEVPSWVTNIQKGVLSAFQTSAVHFDGSQRVEETDVSGKCTAEYQTLGRSWQGTLTIRKQKDLSTCSDRQSVDTSVQGTPYAEHFHGRSRPLVTGSQDCEQVIGNRMLQSSTCAEKHVFRPFSKGGHGVVTTVHQKLTYATVSQRTFTGNDYRPTTETLLFSHLKETASSSRRDEETETALKELCEASKQDISIEVPGKFSAFVYKLKKLPLASINGLYKRIDAVCEGNVKARKFFMDAIPLVSTSESARFIASMIMKKEVSESESTFWLTSLSFISEPTADMIETFTPLLDGRYDQAFLGVSALIHTFCKSSDCSRVPQVQNAVNKLVSNLGENCFSPEDRKIILTLKALSNIGQLFGKENTIMSCYKNPQLRTEVRISAIQVFRRMSCDVSRQDLLDTFSNDVEDSELRVAAYLAVMKCPTEETLSTIRKTLETQTVDHVVSFVWTHLNALLKSRHPERQDIRDIVSNLRLLGKYESDIRKFSSAREATFYLESLDSGFHLDNHVVFATDSYLPRSATFNLTVDVFGHTCNLFQIDGRMEGLERVVESFFGPGGYFPQKNIAKILRDKRSVSDSKLETMDQQFDARSRFNQEPYGSVDVKIFGNSLLYSQFRQGEDGMSNINIMDLVTQLAEQQETEYTRSFMFLDTTFTVPMASGLPLRIAVNGTATVGLKVGGKFNVRSFENVDVLGHIEPSGAIEIASLLTVDAGNTARSGLRVVGTMHSSTFLDGEVRVKNGQVIKAQINMPREKIEIFDVKSKLYLVHGSEEREQKQDKKEGTHMRSCTGDKMMTLFGVKLCSELQLPAYKPNSPLHPVNGPAQFSLYILKTDISLKSYNFDAQWSSDAKSGDVIRRGSISMNTPDSKTDRDLKMELYLNQADRTAMLKIRTPVKKMTINGKLTNDEMLKRLDVNIMMDDKEYFALQTELRETAEKGAISYTPTFEIRLPTRRLVSVTGSAYLKVGQKYSGQLQVEDLTEKPIIAKGNLEYKNNDRYEGELSFSSYALDSAVKGYTQLGGSMSSRINVEYRLLAGRMYKINVIGKVRDLSANALTKYNGVLNVQASALPEWNTELLFETMSTTGHFENELKISLGDGVRSRIHTIRLQEIIRYEGDLSNNKAGASLSLSYPEKNLEYSLKVDHENTERSLKNSMQMQYGSNKEITTDVDLKANTESPVAFFGDVKLNYPGRSTGISAELSETNPNEYRSTASVQWQEGKRVTAVVHYKDRSRSSHLKYEANGQLSLPSRSPMTFATTIGAQQGQLVCSVELNVGVDKYRLKADYLANAAAINHRFTGQLLVNNDVYGTEAFMQVVRGKLTSNVELKLPNRHRVTAKLEGRVGDSFKSGVFETQWDADRDPSKRFAVTSEVREQSDGYDGKFAVQVRHRTVRGMFTTSMQGQVYSSQWKTNNKFEVEWAPKERISVSHATNVLLDRSKQQITGSLEVLTPYYGYENTSLSLTHMYANQQWNSDISTSWSTNKHASLASTGKYSFIRGGASIETTARLQTPLRNFEDLSIQIEHDHNTRELTNKIQLQLGSDKKITTQVSGMMQPTEYKGTVKLSTPFANFRDLSADVIHSFTQGNCRTSGEFQWAARKKVIINFDGRHSLNGRRRICAMNLSANTPFRGFENTGAKLTFNNDGVTLNAEAETTWNRNKMTSGFTGSVRNSLYNKNMESKMHFTSPFESYENIQLATSLELNENSYKVNIDTQLPNHATASLNSQGKMMSIRDIEVNAVVVGHFPNYIDPKRASIDFVHKFQNSNLRSTLDASYGEKQMTVLLIGMTESSFRSRNVEFSLTVTTPARFGEMKADFMHNQRGNDYLTKAQFSKNAMNVALTHKLNVRDAMNFETTMEMTSTTSVPNAKVSVVQVSGADQIEHNSYVQWGKNSKINFNAQYFDKSTSKEIVLKLNTPYRGIRDFEMKSVYEHQNWQRKSSISVTWERRNKMTLDAHLRNYYYKNFLGQLEFTSTFAGYEYYKLGSKYDVTLPKKTVELDYQWGRSEDKLVTAKGTFLLSDRMTQLEAEVRTPFKELERVSISTKYENAEHEKSVSIIYQRGWRKITLVGKSIIKSNEASVHVEVSSPFELIKDLKTSAIYKVINGGMSGELTAVLNNDYMYLAKGRYEISLSTGNAKLTLVTPASQIGTVNIETNFENSYNKKNLNFALEWSDNKKVSLSGSYDQQNYNGAEITANIQTSFNALRQMALQTSYSMRNSQYDGKLRVMINQRNVYFGNLNVKYGLQNLGEMNLELDTPHSPFRNVKLVGIITNENGRMQLTSNMKWEDKEMDTLVLLNRNQDKFAEAKFQLMTPFEGFRVFSVDATIRNERYQFINGELTAVTPFESFSNLKLNAEYKSDHSGIKTYFKMETPSKKMEVNGNVSNRRFQPFAASLEIKAPFTTFKTLTAKADINMKQLTDASGQVSIATVDSMHSLEASISKDDSSLNLELNAECTMWRHRNAVLKVKADYDDPKSVDGEALVKVFGKSHGVAGQFRDTGRDMQFTGKVQSTLLPEEKADVSAILSRRRGNKVLEGKVTVALPSSRHEASGKYETNNRQMAIKGRVESGLLPFETLESEIKYVNSNSRDMEVSVSVTTGDDTRTVVGSLKNYETEKFLQVKSTCPRGNSVSFTATLKHDGYQAMDGSISVTYPSNEIRIAGNMKRVKFDNIEAFLTINTPFEPLRMLRLDGRFNNENFKNIECNFQLETSNKNLPSLGLTSKLSRTEGSEDLSLMIHLPLRYYRTVQLLVNAHYNSDFSQADSRVTFSLPPKRYSLYGQYGIANPRISGTTEIEWDGHKWSAGGRLEATSDRKALSLNLKKPNSDTYNIGGAYMNSDNLYSVAATYTNPDGNVLDANVTTTYNDPTNFDLEFKVNTPYRKYKNVEGHVRQQYNSNYVSTNLEYIKNGRRGYARSLHKFLRNGVTGSVHMGCPYSRLSDVKISYSHIVKRSDKECSLELDFNRVKQFKAELMRYGGGRSSHVLIDAPVLPLTITANSKQIPSGRELNFKSDYMSRIMSFRSSYQKEDTQFLHDASLAWDERADKKISYDFKMTDMVAGDFRGKEIFGKIDFPLRSVILKSNFTKASRTRSGGVDFYWDASRSLDKHMSFGVEHQDLSTHRKFSHKLIQRFAHPKLARELVQTNVLTFGDAMFHAKHELHYSPLREHNFLAEVVANAVASDSRETHYRGELTMRHPVSRLDVRAVAELTDNKLESSANLRLNHVDRRQMQRVHEIKGKIFKLRQQIDLLMKSNDDQMTLLGKMNGRLGEFNMSIEQKVNDQKNMMTTVIYSRRNSRLDVDIENSENTGVKASVTFPADSASFKISHKKNGDEVTDVSAYVGLETSRVLKSQANWRPRMMEDLRITTGENLRALVRSTKRVCADLASAVSEEVDNKMALMSRSVSEQLRSFLKDVDKESTGIIRDLLSVGTTVEAMYGNNEFYMQDIAKGYEIAKEISSEVFGVFGMTFEVLYNITMEFLDELYYDAYYFCQDLMVHLQKLHSETLLKLKRLATAAGDALVKAMEVSFRKMGEALSAASGKMKEFARYCVVKVDGLMRVYAPCIIDGYYYTKMAADNLREYIEKLASSTQKYITTNKYYVALTNYASSVMETIQAFRDLEYRDTAQEFLNRVYNMRLMESVLNHPHFEYMSSVTNSALRKGVEMYHTLGMDSVVSNAMDTATAYVKNLALNTAQEILEEVYQMRGGAKYTFDPRRGHMSYEVHLPAARSSLIEVFDLKSYPEYQKVMNMKNNVVAEYYENFCVWDFYYKFMKYFTPSYWLPNFRAHATVAGNQHYITFDKLPFEFAGQCSYLLARDFVDGNFTVIVNYARDGQSVVRKSLTILTEGRKLDVGHNYKVTLDDVKTELPIQVGKTVVIREGSNVRVENERKGFSIDCNFVHNYCTVSVSGFYFGKTAGLFGTYNYHPRLDKMTPARYFANNIEEFADSWEVGQGSCQTAENLATLPSNDYRVQQRCKALFEKSTSDFRACFKQVDPEAYKNMCINDLSAIHEHKFDEAICVSAAAYFAECKMEGVPLKMPKQCVRCQKQDGAAMTEGDAVKYTGSEPTLSSDVVFLVEEKACNQDKVRHLAKLAQVIEESFRQSGGAAPEVHFRVVGFGGEGVHAAPHVHTLDGQEHGPLRHLESSLASLEFAEDGPVNVLEALRFAAALDFRAGSAKSFVLAKCSTCKAEEVKAEYSEMLRTLLDGDITLHLLMEQRYEMKVANKNSKARRVIGVDRKFAYTLKDVKDSKLSGDGDLLAQLKIPKDVCIPLALEVNGSSFDAQYLADTRKNTNKKFMDVLARLVVRSSERRSEFGLCCECVATVDGVGKSVCQRCVSAEMAEMISGNSSGFNNSLNGSTDNDDNDRYRKGTQRRGAH